MISASPSAGLAGAFLFGLLGSLSHCIAMCGGIVAAVQQRDARHAGIVLYHAGRLTTYTAIGAAVGLAGTLVNFAGDVTPWLRGAAAIAAGIVMTLTGLSMLGAGGRLPERVLPVRWVSNAGAKLMSRRGLDNTFLLGIVFGFLPCGLIYTAASYSLASANPLHGGALMLAFGLGTLPALATASALIRWARRFGNAFRYAAGALLVASGIYYLVAGFPG